MDASPIEISSVTSVWLKEQQSKYKVSAKSVLFDFNVHYVATVLLALAFLALGALVFYGSGLEFSQSGIEFSNQLIDGYTSKVGQWPTILSQRWPFAASLVAQLL